MFAIVGGLIFSGAALFALLVIVQMLRGYLPTMVAALEGNPLPRTLPVRPEPRRRMRRVPARLHTAAGSNPFALPLDAAILHPAVRQQQAR